MEEADGLGAFVLASESEVVADGLMGLAVDVLALFALVVLLVSLVSLELAVAGAGGGELFWSCGDELLEPRSTDWPPRCELRRTRC